MIKQTKGQSTLSVALIVAGIIVIIVLGIIYAVKELPKINPGQHNDVVSGESKLGGTRDEGGCLISAGYSWCEIKQDCLRTWEEPCLPAGQQALLEEYLEDNISELSSTKEVLGGTFYITNFKYTGDDSLILSYEDGHIALEAGVEFSFDNEEVVINDFVVLDNNDAGVEEFSDNE